MHHGFRLAEEADLLAAFTGLADIDVAFASGTICASAYFNSGWDHCDDAVTNDVWNSPAAWGGPYDQQSFNETLVLRDGNGVPGEPSAIALAGLAPVRPRPESAQGSASDPAPIVHGRSPGLAPGLLCGRADRSGGLIEPVLRWRRRGA